MKLAPGVNLELSWKRALGVTAAKRKIARATGIPTTRRGIEQKSGRLLLRMLTLGLWRKR